MDDVSNIEINSYIKPTILILDSGVGGLSIYDEVRQLLLGINYIYVFDNVGFPYGEKSKKYIIKSVVSIVKEVTKRFLLDLLIVACNSASVISLPTLRKCFKFPIIGVVPAIKPAAGLTRNGIIGLLATKNTVNSDYTHKLIMQFANKCIIKMIGSSELVHLAEEKLYGKKISLKDIEYNIKSWLYIDEPPDTIVLGCTHFSLLRDELQSIFPNGTQLVDSRKAIAYRTFSLFQSHLLKLKKSFIFIDNKAYCTKINDKVIQLLPVLKRYGFSTLEELKIDYR